MKRLNALLCKLFFTVCKLRFSCLQIGFLVENGYEENGDEDILLFLEMKTYFCLETKT